MTFQTQLNTYMTLLECSAKDLATVSEVSESTISRYRSGERIPEGNSEQLHKIANGIATLATERSHAELSKENVFSALSEALIKHHPVTPWNASNFHLLITEMGINMTNLARYMNFDASYLSRVHSGQRTPANPTVFSQSIAQYVTSRFTDETSHKKLAGILECDEKSLTSESVCIHKILHYLTAGITQEGSSAESFLAKVNDFDLNEYIRAIKFNELKVPAVPFQMISSKNYFGLEGIKDAELSFFKSTVLAKNMEPVFMHSDMPMDDMAEDKSFAKKWMFGLAMMLKKGLHINIIHNLDRPFSELMLGLEAWIPMYMTGQVHPYYMDENNDSLYRHLNYCSGQVALIGECVNGHHEDSKYYLSRLKEEVAYQKKKCAHLLQHAHALMDIYTPTESAAFHERISEISKIPGMQYDKLHSLPLFTMTSDLLNRILEHNNLTPEEKEKIKSYHKRYQTAFETSLKYRTIKEEISYLSENEFASYPVMLDLSGSFIENSVSYSYEEYREHLNSLETYKKAHKNYSYDLTTNNAFRNIQIYTLPNKLVVMSKNTAPAIQFIIQHPTLVNAIENFTVPLTDNGPAQKLFDD